MTKIKNILILMPYTPFRGHPAESDFVPLMNDIPFLYI
jgi:hypothetical protein